MSFWGTIGDQRVHLAVLCDYSTDFPTCNVFQWDSLPVRKVLEKSHEIDSILWSDLVAQVPELVRRHVSVEIKAGDTTFQISFSPKKEMVESMSKEHEVFSIRFKIDRLPDNLREAKISSVLSKKLFWK